MVSKEQFVKNYTGIYDPEKAYELAKADDEINRRYGSEHRKLASEEKRIAFDRIMRR